MLSIFGILFFGVVKPFLSLRLHTFSKEGKVNQVYINIFE